MNGIRKFVILFSFLSMAFVLNARNSESEKISVGDSLFNSVRNYYTDGVNITIDDGYTEKVLTTMLEAASAGHSGACYFLGRYYWFSAWSNNENYKESFKWFLKGYESGSSDCAFWLRVLYDNGQGVEQDKKTATRLFIESARKGDTRAIPRLESLTKTYIANADLEDADIQLYLAIMSEYGLGVEQNRSKAVTYYRKSADLGNKIAQERLSAKDKEYNSYFENGKTEKTGYLNMEGLMIGEWKTFYEEGPLSAIGNYESGKKDGEWKGYHPNGKIFYTALYEKGKETGEWKCYYGTNGQLSRIMYFENGSRTGKWKEYYENKQLKKTENYSADKPEGEWKSYFENGKLKSKERYSDGILSGEFDSYYDNGNLEFTGVFVNGKLEGKADFYDESGKVSRTGMYKDGEMTGKWKYYYPTEKGWALVEYMNNEPVGKSEFYNEAGVLVARGDFDSNDKMNGEWKFYDEAGKLRKEGSYKNGIETGEWKYYDENGLLVSTEKFLYKPKSKD